MSLRRSASQVSPQILSLLVLHPNIPDKPPKPAVACGLWGLGLGSAAQVSLFGLGGFLSFGSFARALPRRSLFGYTLRERHGFPFHAPQVRLLQEF